MTERATRLTYLDGVRGWAALSVVVFHSYWEMLRDLWPSPLNLRLLLLTDGKFAVLVFFVLSGFALSTGYFRSRRADGVRHLALRRYLRLTIPIAVVSVLAIALSQAGLFFNRAAGEVINARSHWLAAQYPGAGSLSGSVKYLLYHVYFITEDRPYGAQLWTMSWEMQGSFLVFGLLMLLRPDRSDRFVWYGAALALFLNLNSLFACFIFGVILADLDASGCLASKAGRRRAMGIAGICLFLIVVLYRLLFNPTGGYAGVLNLTMAAALIAAVVMSPGLQWLFQCRLSQFLGKISFPLYLSHVIVICSLGSWLALVMHDAGYSSETLYAVVLVTCIVVSLVLATLLWPIEDLAIATSRWFSTAVLNGGWAAGVGIFSRPRPVERPGLPAGDAS